MLTEKRIYDLVECSCHNLPTGEFSGESLSQGGFGVKLNAETSSDLSPITALLNLEDPPSSALVRFSYGEFDHFSLDLGDEVEATLIEWISRIATQMGVTPTQE